MVDSIALEKLQIYFPVAEGTVKAVDNITVSFEVGTYTAIIGESGCGKSVLGQAILGTLPLGVLKSGRVSFKGHNLLEKVPNNYYTECISVIPQNPGESFNPIRTIGKQMLDALPDLDKVAALRVIEQRLTLFGLDNVKSVLAAYPYELSGGMQQRVLCAMSMLRQPIWVLADEPTKGIDEETAELVYNNLLKIKADSECGMIIITHDIKLARSLCDKIAVMYSGQIVELGEDTLKKPLHPYTKAFVEALPENGFQPLEGIAPTPGEDIKGCKFAPRCKYCMEKCKDESPREYCYKGAVVRCFLYADRQ